MSVFFIRKLKADSFIIMLQNLSDCKSDKFAASAEVSSFNKFVNCFEFFFTHSHIYLSQICHHVHNHCNCLSILSRKTRAMSLIGLSSHSAFVISDHNSDRISDKLTSCSKFSTLDESINDFGFIITQSHRDYNIFHGSHGFGKHIQKLSNSALQNHYLSKYVYLVYNVHKLGDDTKCRTKVME